MRCRTCDSVVRVTWRGSATPPSRKRAALDLKRRRILEVVRDNDLFDAVLVSAGRFGVIYSVVVAAVPQLTAALTPLPLAPELEPDLLKYASHSVFDTCPSLLVSTDLKSVTCA